MTSALEFYFTLDESSPANMIQSLRIQFCRLSICKTVLNSVKFHVLVKLVGQIFWAYLGKSDALVKGFPRISDHV